MSYSSRHVLGRSSYWHVWDTTRYLHVWNTTRCLHVWDTASYWHHSVPLWYVLHSPTLWHVAGCRWHFSCQDFHWYRLFSFSLRLLATSTPLLVEPPQTPHFCGGGTRGENTLRYAVVWICCITGHPRQRISGAPPLELIAHQTSIIWLVPLHLPNHPMNGSRRRIIKHDTR